MTAKITLTITQGTTKGQEFIFDDRTTCIMGRATDCHPKLPDDKDHNTVSRYHCLLDINPPQIRIRDFGSRNGTYINGTLIGKRHPETTPEQAKNLIFPEHDLHNGDEIKLGNTLFQVTIETPIETPIEATQPITKFADREKTNVLAHVKQLVQQADANTPNDITIEGYTLLKYLGGGGFGDVYLARNQKNQEEIALKILLPQMQQNEYIVNLFLREIENTKALSHPNIVTLRDYGKSNELFYFTLDYCNKGSISDLMRQRQQPLTLKQASSIIIQTLHGLEYSHTASIPNIKQADGSYTTGQGIVHRDLKPANLFLHQIGNNTLVKIGDYGISKAFDQAGFSGLSMSGTMAGTPYFMSRPQLINFKYAKPEVDIWAAAACFYYMLTYTHPRDFTDPSKDPFRLVLETSAVPIRQRNSSIPKPVAEVIDKALIDNPSIPFKTAAEFRQALESVL
jgi:eukaryotic-like serine/threonine-protein kinase